MKAFKFPPSGHSRGSSAVSTSSLRRAAFARPRVLLSVMTALTAAGTWWAIAQRDISKIPIGTPITAIPPNAKQKFDPKRKPLTWDRLPQMVNDYGLHRAARARGKGIAPTAVGLPAIGPNRFPLTEVDLTSGNISDEREPDYRVPTGDLITFASNGVDADSDGRLDARTTNTENRYHIWIMRRNGTQQRQITGLGSDKNFNQRNPSWSPDGRRIVYVGSTSATSEQLFIVDNVQSTTTRPTVQQVTFFGGSKRDPAWSPSGTAIAFAANAAPTVTNQNTSLGQFDIFTISPTGSTATVRRLTGDADNNEGGNPSASDPQDLVGNSTDDWAPAYSQANPGTLFFSTNRQSTVTVTGTGAGQVTTVTVGAISSGRRIFAMNAVDGSRKRQITNPTARTAGAADDIDDNPSPSLTQSFTRRIPDPPFSSTVTFRERIAFESTSRIDRSDTTADLNIWSLPVNSSSQGVFLGTGTTLAPVEDAPSAVIATVESNLFSSPNQARAAGFAGAAEDKSADREPAFSRANTSADLITPIAFASQRRVAPRPGTNGLNPAPPVVNPGGGSAATATHDIWTTRTEDTTPPLLIPVSVGNQQFPLVAPGRQAPFFAPRTAEEGLNPGGKLIVAAVISEPESGLSTGQGSSDPAVSVVIKDAEQPTFSGFLSNVNESKPVVHAVERPPTAVTGKLPLAVFDDGPPRTVNGRRVGNERQANAIAGDGIYYAQGSIDAVDTDGVPLNGDFYIDLVTTDRNGNSLTYDHVYGFSTRPFRKQANLLFVSDYTVGQSFPLELVQRDFEGRTFPLANPVESYWLENPGGIVLDNLTDRKIVSFPTDRPFVSLTVNGDADITTFSPPGSASFGSAVNSVDVWRVLSRGAVTEDVFDLYSPQVELQLDPNLDPDNDNRPGPFGEPTRRVTVAESAVVWAAPYTGSVFGSPGTLFDVDSQRRLMNFLSRGGRLFLSGQDVVFALSNAGTVTNQFLEEELRTGYGNEAFASDVQDPGFGFTIAGEPGGAGAQIANRHFVPQEFRDPPLNLHVPFNPAGDPDTDTYYDAADTDFGLDIITPLAARSGETISPLFRYGSAGLGGQAIEKVGRGEGFDSRVVFFGFGLEMINREYTNGDKLKHSRNYRSKIAENVANFLRTGRINGKVINAATNLPIPNFLVEVGDRAGNRFFIARTDQNGNYEISGIPARDRFYLVNPATFVANGQRRSLNPGFFSNPTVGTELTVLGGETLTDVNFRVIPSPPSTITGRAISDRGTVAIGDDATPEIEVAPNVPVLLRTPEGVILPPSNTFPVGGTFAILTQTDASGRFVFSGVPGDLPVEIIFNPRPQVSDSKGKIVDNGDIPQGSGIIFNNTTSQIRPNPNFGRRLIPVDPAYNGPRPPGVPGTGATIIVSAGTTLDLGDIPIPLAGSTVSGLVLRNGAPVATATVELLSNGVVTQTRATGVDGRYSFDNVQPGTYTVRASIIDRGTTISGQTSVTVTRGNNSVAPNINLTTSTGGGTPTPGPTVRPTPMPTPTQSPANEEFQVGDLDQISIPYADSTSATATTTVGKAFTALVGSTSDPNFRLTRYNALTQTYEVLNDRSIIRRGEGFFIRPLKMPVSIKRPPGVPGPIGPRFTDRKPTTVTEFTVTLRRDASHLNDANSGFNLIGYPFDPAKYRSIDWLESRVIAPDGRIFPTLQQAVSNGLISGNLFTLRSDGTPYDTTTVIEPFKGYFAKTFVDGVRVVLKARSR